MFELTLSNADKGTIGEDVLAKRIAQFEERGLDLVVTREPMFLEKAKFLTNCSFILGFDTYIRVIDLKYYDYSIDKMLKKFTETRDIYGGNFLVAGRACSKPSIPCTPD